MKWVVGFWLALLVVSGLSSAVADRTKSGILTPACRTAVLVCTLWNAYVFWVLWTTTYP